MNQLGRLPIERWTTYDVPGRQRFDYYADALGRSITPMTVGSSASAEKFLSEIVSINVGPLAVIRCVGSSHVAARGAVEIGRSEQHSFHLLLNRTTGHTLQHRNALCLRPRDLVLTDSYLPHELTIPDGYNIVHIKLTESFLRRWVPMPGVLVGRRFEHQSGWGAALSAFTQQLSPEFVSNSPLPHSLLSDQLGALLALLAQEHAGTPVVSNRLTRQLRERVHEAIIERCTDTTLTATDVAAMLKISPRTLHRCLAAHGETFGDALIGARADVALRMLQSPIFDKLSIAQIGRRAGFSAASHFARVMRRRCGDTPLRLRRER
jgi:AraC-like DNA-binding protein